jgi:hypothetical protein
MRNFDRDSNWTLRLGEVEIYDQENKYILVIGYVNGLGPAVNDPSIYVRLYNNSNQFIFGKWLNGLRAGYETSITGELFILSTALYEKIKKQTNRLEALKVFA